MKRNDVLIGSCKYGGPKNNNNSVAVKKNAEDRVMPSEINGRNQD